MAFDNFVFQAAWFFGRHVGAFKPSCVVEVQRGRFVRGYKRLPGGETAATIPGETARRPWRAWWEAETAWKEIPGVSDFTFSDAIGSQNGMTVGSITFQNVGFAQKTGPMGGIYHAIERGLLSPTRGYRASGRPTTVGKSEWYEVLTKGARIRVWAGYGAPQRDSDGGMPDDGGPNGGWLFNGLIDDLDPRSMPATLQLTLREGSPLSDEKLFGFNKSPQLDDPVTFCDRLDADKVTAVGSGARASSSDPGSPPRHVLSSSGGGSWRSHPHTSADATEWVEIRLPAGRYSDFVLDPLFDGMECFVGVYLKGGGTVDGEEDSGWVGSGTVPGEHGGWKYLRHIPRVGTGRTARALGAEIVCKDDSVLRVGFRALPERGGEHRAGVAYLRARRRHTEAEATSNKWILVDDIADVVVCVLRWAGYEEWEVERQGIRLKGKVVFNRATYLIDIIKAAEEQTGNVFHMQDPPSGDSWGIPTFRQNRALKRPKSVIEVRDDQTLTDIDPKFSNAPLPYIIRVRGKEAEPQAGAVTLGGDKSKRIMAVYRPPWHERNRLAGVIKHEVATLPNLRTYEECYVACYLIAVNAALQYATATAEILANPGIALDSQVGLVDEATGVNTRLWVTNREINGQFGGTASFKMAFGGSMIDTADMQELIKQIDSGVASGSINPGGKVVPA
jgi:hypothetical protein